MLVLIAYLAVAITAFNRKPADQTCRDMELVIKDTAYAGFITKEELKGILQHKGIYPIGKKAKISIAFIRAAYGFIPVLLMKIVGSLPP